MKKLKILIAEDEVMLQELYEMILESEYACDITKVASGYSAIEILNRVTDFDLIISDYTMPNGNGGKVYLHNKTKSNIPFFLLSGGDIRDYSEFHDFKVSNKFNTFFNKPFNDQEFLDAAALILESKENSLSVMPTSSDKFIKIKLDFYIKHTNSAAEVYIKLNEDKYTKIIQLNDDNSADAGLLSHYSNKGIEFIYVKEDSFKLFINDIYDHYSKKLLGEQKTEFLLELSGLKFNISFEGLNNIGITSEHIKKVNVALDETIRTLFSDSTVKRQFQSLCEMEGFIIGHSLLITYIAGRICIEGDSHFQPLMKKICAAAFYHDFSLFEMDAKTAELELSTIKDEKLIKLFLEHPLNSANYLPECADITEDIKKIILEHHELPNGDGYPRKLTASQISSLSCLFIISQQITFCLIRNNFSKERLSDFLVNQESLFNQGNFSKYYRVARKIFT